MATRPAFSDLVKQIDKVLEQLPDKSLLTGRWSCGKKKLTTDEALEQTVHVVQELGKLLKSHYAEYVTMG